MQMLVKKQILDGTACKTLISYLHIHRESEKIPTLSRANIRTRIFWQNCTGGLLNHADFFETIAGNVRIHVGDIDSLDKNTLRLKNGDEILTDALLCGTGWLLSLQFFSEAQRLELGLPHLTSQESPNERMRWTQLEAASDVEVLATFPQLGKPPPHYSKPMIQTPYRLYRHIAPLSESSGAPEDRSIVFIGQVGVGNYFPLVECQSMWATAYLDRKISLPKAKLQEEDVALFIAWCRRRYLSSGGEGNNMTFELVGYCDTLLGDLGLSSNRKGWFNDIFAPIWARDFAGLAAEFKEKYGYSLH